MSTCEPPADLPITGVGRLLEARVCRPKKSTDKGEATATAVSDAVPFLQYDLHQQIMYKLKVRIHIGRRGAAPTLASDRSGSR